MTKSEAAKYFVIAWVKGWSIRLYLRTITGKNDFRFEDAHAAYPWLPADVNWYFRNVTIRRYAAEAMRSINDSLFDANDHVARLKLHPKIMNFSGATAKVTQNKDAKEIQASIGSYRKASFGEAKSVGEMRRGNGYAWNVCK